jgi:divalent metal cation (Fe/Co/Zn/Cd) transporter
VSAARHQLLRRAVAISILSIVVSGLAGGAATVVALESGSLSLLGFGFDAAVDSVASLALVWRFSIEAREPLRAERVERIAEGIVGMTLIVLAVDLGVSAIRALVTASHPEPTVVGTALLVFSVVALPPIALAKHRLARTLASGALRADSILTGVAAFLASIGVVALGMSQAFGVTWADAVGGLVGAAILIREGAGALRAARGTDLVSSS